MCAQLVPFGEYLRGHGRVRLMWLLCAACVGSFYARATPSCSGLRANVCCPAWQLVVIAFVNYQINSVFIVQKQRVYWQQCTQ